MKKQSMNLPFSRYPRSLPASIRDLINEQYPEIVALAQHGYHRGGRGAITIIDGGSVGYFFARELHVFLGVMGGVIQEVVRNYQPAHEIVMCILVADHPPYVLVLQQDAPAPLDSAQHILPGRLPLIPSA